MRCMNRNINKTNALSKCNSSDARKILHHHWLNVHSVCSRQSAVKCHRIQILLKEEHLSCHTQFLHNFLKEIWLKVRVNEIIFISK